MPIVHVYPTNDVRQHVTKSGGCWCEPRVENCGADNTGGPARVMVHTDQAERRGLPPQGGS